MKIYCIGSEAAVRGFALVGVEGVTPEEDALRDTLQDVLLRPDVGVVLITERLAAALGDEIPSWSLTHRHPLILEIPDEGGPLAGRTTVLSLVKDALGLGQTDEQGI